MITYVNTVFVSNNDNARLLGTMPTANNATKGDFLVVNVDNGDLVHATYSDPVDRIKIGMVTGKTYKDHKGVSHPDIKWSNIINIDDIKSMSMLTAPQVEETEDKVEIDFSSVDASVINLFAQGGKRIIVRLTFKDLPTRFRKWTESYEYVTVEGDTATTIASALKDIITKQWNRARVNATANAGKLTLEAMPYDDDNSADTINVANKVRFNANVYYTDPAAEGWESLNKHFPKGLTIKKTPGFQYAAAAKLVRDREAQAMGYLGILNRGEGTWPIVKPEMETKLDNKYNAFIIEFENTYRAADDIFRKTKQTVEIYATRNLDGTFNDLFDNITTSRVARFDQDTEDGVADE